MVGRLALVAALLTLGAITGGWGGLAVAFLTCGLLGFLIGPPKRDPMDERDEQNEIYDEIHPARRGSEIDPTRPTREDYKAMHEVRRETVNAPR